MANTLTIELPDIGDVDSVDVVEIIVSVGQRVEVESPLITLESDKATMDLPSTTAGTVTTILVQVGDVISKGSPVLILETDATHSVPPAKDSDSQTTPPKVAADNVPISNADHEFDLVVVGSGPGGYTAAFRAADLGLNTALVEQFPVLGGVCLNVGCIPSKALLHAARVITEADEMQAFGVSFGQPTIDLNRLRQWKQQIVGQLTGGLNGLAKQRKVTVLRGEGRFQSPNHLVVNDNDSATTVQFKQAIIATGSRPTQLPGLPNDDRIIDSTGALALAEIPERLLVIGGGIIGPEMATVYAAPGTDVTVVELLDQ